MPGLSGHVHRSCERLRAGLLPSRHAVTRVPRYYFHLHETVDVEDEEGAELPDLAGAREYALENARDMVCGDIKTGVVNVDHRIEVVDEEGQSVLSLTFGEAFMIEHLEPAEGPSPL
jgi:hypothetical protein